MWRWRCAVHSPPQNDQRHRADSGAAVQPRRAPTSAYWHDRSTSRQIRTSACTLFAMDVEARSALVEAALALAKSADYRDRADAGVPSLCLMVSVVSLFCFDRREVVAVLEGPAVLNQSTHSAVAISRSSSPSTPPPFDQLCLVEPDHLLRQRVVIRLSDRSGLALDPRGRQLLLVRHDRYCTPWSWCAISRQSLPSRPCPDGLLHGVHHELAGHRGRHRPAQDPPRVGIDDERGVAPARPRRYIREVRHPQPVWCQRVGSSGPPVRSASGRGSLIVVRLTLPLTAPPSPELVHQSLHGAPCDPRRLTRAFPVQRQPDLPLTVDAVVLYVRLRRPLAFRSASSDLSLSLFSFSFFFFFLSSLSSLLSLPSSLISSLLPFSYLPLLLFLLLSSSFSLFLLFFLSFSPSYLSFSLLSISFSPLFSSFSLFYLFLSSSSSFFSPLPPSLFFLFLPSPLSLFFLFPFPSSFFFLLLLLPLLLFFLSFLTFLPYLSLSLFYLLPLLLSPFLYPFLPTLPPRPFPFQWSGACR